MSHNDSPKFSIPILVAALLIGLLLAIISFYSYKPCASSTCTKPATAAVISDSNKYITVAGPNGDVVKVSSKLSALTAYITDKDDVATTDSDNGFWKTKFKSWRDKMVQNNIAPSLANFMDVVELSKVVQQN